MPPSHHLWGFPGGSDGKESVCNAGDSGSIPELGRSPREGNGNPLQYSCLENAMNRGAWWATVHGVAKSWTWLSDSHTHTHTHTHTHISSVNYPLRILPFYHTSFSMVSFRGDSDSKESTCNVRNLGSVPGLGRSPGGGRGNSLQYSCLENPHGQRGLVGCSP